MKRRTRRRLAATIAALVAIGVYTTSHNPTAAAITSCTVGLAVLATSLVRPTRRRRRTLPRHRRGRPRIRTQHAIQLEHALQVLYRLYDQYGRLLYVGVVVTHPGRNVRDRIEEHADDPDKAAWFPQVDLAGVVIQYYGSRTEVYAAEADAIHTEQPLYNRTHRSCIRSKCKTVTRARRRGYPIPPTPLPPQSIPKPYLPTGTR